MFPFVFINYLTQLSESIKFDKKFVELDISFEKLNMLTPKQKKGLRAIKGGEFTKETNAKNEDALV